MNKQPLLLSTKILDIDTPNKNGRIYPESTAQAIVDSINSGTVLGHLGTSPFRQALVNLNEVSHQVANARIINGAVVVDIQVLDTPNGKALSTLLQDEDLSATYSIGFRPSGVGEVNADGEVVNYTLSSVDALNNPA